MIRSHAHPTRPAGPRRTAVPGRTGVPGRAGMLGLATLLALGGCAAPGTGITPQDALGAPDSRQRQGVVLGGIAGAVAGAATGEEADDRLARAAIGGAIGAAAGGAIGNRLDAQEEALRQQLDNRIGVVNTGERLVVNLPQDILFQTDSASLRPDLQSDLRAVASNLQQFPDTTVQVVGHADNTGAAAYNQDLSQRRAQTVAGVLAGAGVNPGRISAFGRGEDQPIASNLTPEGRAQNRRVEIIITPTR